MRDCDIKGEVLVGRQIGWMRNGEIGDAEFEIMRLGLRNIFTVSLF